MNQRDDIRRELEEIAPSLAKIEKKEPFRAPDGYFEQFPQHIRTQIAGQPGTASASSQVMEALEQWLSILLRPAYATGFSVVLLLLITGSYALYLNQQTGSANQQEMSLSMLSSQEVDAYLSEHIEQFDESVISESVGNLQAVETSGNETFSMDEIDSEELDQYIMANIQQETIQHEMP